MPGFALVGQLHPLYHRHPMTTDLDESCLEYFGKPAHPEANRLLPDSDGFWFLINDDRVHDAAEDFAEWRRANPDTPVVQRLEEIAATWDFPTTYDESILTDEAIQTRVDADPHFDLELWQAVCVLDSTIITTAFCDFFLTGKMCRETRRIVSLAIRREMDPRVLRASDENWNGETPVLSSLLEVVRVLGKGSG